MIKYFIIFLFFISTLFSDMKVYVANNSEINSITEQELKNLYLKKTHLLNGREVVVIDNTEEYSSFYNQVIGKTDNQIYAYWMKQIFLGKKIPPKKIASSQLNTILKKNSSTIVYSQKDLDAKVIYEYK